jgi:hypothetical protein
MSMMSRSRFSLESLDDRITPTRFDGLPAFTGLDVAVEHFAPVDPCRCLEVSPVFVLNYGLPLPPPIDELSALNGLIIADNLVPPNPTSPVFFGLEGFDGPPVDSPM